MISKLEDALALVRTLDTARQDELADYLIAEASLPTIQIGSEQ